MAAATYRQKLAVVHAVQWFKNGDHPEDNVKPEEVKEGEVVRYYRHPDVPGIRECRRCQRTMHCHGWIDVEGGGNIVCPGDWVVTGVSGLRVPYKPDVFAATFEAV